MKWSSLKGDGNFNDCSLMFRAIPDMKWSSLKGDGNIIYLSKNKSLMGYEMILVKRGRKRLQVLHHRFSSTYDMKWSSLKGDGNLAFCWLLLTGISYDMKWSSLKGDGNNLFHEFRYKDNRYEMILVKRGRKPYRQRNTKTPLVLIWNDPR